MFTGIIRHVGGVESAAAAPSGKRLTVSLGPLAEGLSPGDSVSVNGACLTVSHARGEQAVFDVVAETLQRTTLGELSPGHRVNLERALAVGQRLDGHWVQGHVDGVAEVRRVQRGAEWEIEFSAPRALTGQMVPKGSVAVDGVSLTLTSVSEGRFGVALIPTTIRQTTLGDLAPPARVNVETDVIGKYVRGYLDRLGGGGTLTLEKLKETGFA